MPGQEERAEPTAQGQWDRGLLATSLVVAAAFAVEDQTDCLRSGRETYITTNAGNVREASQHYQRALANRPLDEIETADAFAEMVSGLAPKIWELPKGERPVRMLRQTAGASREAISAVVHEHTEKSRLRIRYAGTLVASYILEQDKEYLRQAIEQTERAVGSDPNRITYYHTLADLYRLWGAPKAELTELCPDSCGIVLRRGARAAG